MGLPLIFGSISMGMKVRLSGEQLAVVYPIMNRNLYPIHMIARDRPSDLSDLASQFEIGLVVDTAAKRMKFQSIVDALRAVRGALILCTEQNMGTVKQTLEFCALPKAPGLSQEEEEMT